MSAGLSRRGFLIATAAVGGGLLLTVAVRRARRRGDPRTRSSPFAWLQIAPDGTVTIQLDQTEMGQGVTTALSMVVAEELGVGWNAVRVGPVVDDPARWIRAVETGASRSVRRSVDLLKHVGAAAREMLIAAAAAQWSVAPSSCQVTEGVIHHHASGRRMTYGSIAERAATLEPPATPSLVPAHRYRLLGTGLPRLDTTAKVTGRAEYGIDVRLPGMLVASIERSPVPGGNVRRVDSSATLAVPGVRRVITLPALGRTKGRRGAWRTYTEAGVAVLADDYWSALKGRQALGVEWDDPEAARLSTTVLRTRLADGAARPGTVARHTGDVAAALAGAAQRLEAVYETPLLHHATLEPMNGTADVRKDWCDVWAPMQKQTEAQRVAAAVSGLPIGRVRVHTTQLGGGFGRRQENDFVAEAVHLSREVGHPVKVMWSREDDTRHGFYRPATRHHLMAALSATGELIGWTHHVVGLSIAEWKFNYSADEIDPWLVEGAADLPYGIPNILVDQTIVEYPIPRGFYRSTGASHNSYVTECFIDEVARLAERDPYQFRRALLANEPRILATLDLAAERAGWNNPVAPGVGRGLAVVRYSGSVVAMVCEVAVRPGAHPVPKRFVCAIDCGPPINPDIIAAQIEGSIVDGLSAALYGTIDIDHGTVRQSNFHDYRVLRLPTMPAVEVHIVPSRHPAGGVGELAVAATIPAFCNAAHAATARPIRSLPVAERPASPRTPAAAELKT